MPITTIFRVFFPIWENAPKGTLPKGRLCEVRSKRQKVDKKNAFIYNFIIKPYTSKGGHI